MRVAKEYAQAFFQSLAEQDKEEAISKIGMLKTFFSTETEAVEKIKANAISTEDLKKAFGSALGSSSPSDITLNFVHLLIDKRRILILPEVYQNLLELLDSEKGIVRGKVKAAQKVDQAKVDQLEDKFSKKFGKKVVLDFQKDESVVAGLKVEIGDYTYDDTVETHIKKINKSMDRSLS